MSSNSPIHGGAVPLSDDSGMKAPCKTEILFRIWRRGNESSESASLEQAKQPGVVAFIEDVVASRRGVLIPTDKNLYVSILDNPSQALVVARQVQMGMEEFQKKSKIKPVAISIAIDANAASAQPSNAQFDTIFAKSPENPLASNPQVSHDLLTLIRMSKPAQVLLTHELFQKVNLFKGLPLKAFQGRFGVFEYLWAAEDKLVDLQKDESLFVDAIEAEKPTFTPVENHSSNEATEPTDFVFHRTVTSHPDTPPNLKLIALVATLLVVVIAGGITFFSRGKKPDPAPEPVNHVVAPVTSTPAHVQPPSGPKLNPSKVHAGPATASEKPPPKPRATPKPAPSSTDDDEPAPTPVPSAREQCQLPGNLQEYLDTAEHYRASGDYKGAERLFTKILVCDPTNARAKTGLLRTKSAE